MSFSKKKTIYIAISTLLIGFFVGWLFFRDKPAATQTESASAAETIWTCTMHPQVRRTEPGLCPICGMELVPLNSGQTSTDPLELKMSPTAMQLANIQTSVVHMQRPEKEIRLNGKVKADESNIYSQVAHISGRIERLLVNFTGEAVRKGQVLAYIYSPELSVAQEELFEAYKIRDTQPELYKAAREKLRNWKLTENQINRIISSGRTQESFPVLADISGTVINKRVNAGDYVQRGESLLEVANLNTVWVLFDVYEDDIPWVNKGDLVHFTVQSLPRKTFTNRISFIDPVIDPARRVSTARVEVSNNDGNLKPDMFASGVVKTPLRGGKNMLTVPESAVMWTGERSIVYVKTSSEDGANFILREIVLGPKVNDSYIVEEGLEAGEEIVTNGTFAVDAAAQLAGKPSMMNPDGTLVPTGHNHSGKTGTTPVGANTTSAVRKALYALVTEYISLKDALVANDLQASKKTAASLLQKTDNVKMNLFEGEAHNMWMNYSKEIKTSLANIKNATTIGGAREHFMILSEHMITLAKTFGPFEIPLYIDRCPMANNNKGARWLSEDKDIRNPYFGADMLTCGEVVSEIK